jgi:tetratricopeptide (TPR) repeat protein
MSDQDKGSTVHPVAVGDKLAQKSADKIAKARELKNDGNTAFNAGNYRTAIKKYHHALMYTKAVVTQGDLSVIPGLEQLTKHKATDEEKAEATELSLTVSNNLAACFLSTEKWEKVVEYASKVLEAHPDNAKALFRRGTACIHLNLIDKAKCDLTRAQEITPDNGGVRKQLAVLERKMRELEIKEQQLYSTMLGNQQ